MSSKQQGTPTNPSAHHTWTPPILRVVDLCAEGSDSDLSELVERVGPGFLRVSRWASNAVHLLRTDDDRAIAEIYGDNFGWIGWGVNLPLTVECGTVLRGNGAIVQQPRAAVTCKTCAYAREGWI